MSLTPRVEAWRAAGHDAEFRGLRIHVHRRDGEGPLLLFLHGFPSSSYDWRFVLAEETRNAALAFDFAGFGLSEKPREQDYSLMWQADLTEHLGEQAGGGAPLFVVAHDMGTSVATELMARDIEGRLRLDLRGALLFNGSMILALATPTLAQKLLRGRLGPGFARLTNRPLFVNQFGSIFSPGHPLTDDEAADQWSLICAGGGRTLGHRLVGYMDERERYAERWHGALRDWPKPLSLAWGMRDPVANPRVLAGIRELRPQAPVRELPDLGHYPQIEDPAQLVAALRDALSASL